MLSVVRRVVSGAMPASPIRPTGKDQPPQDQPPKDHGQPDSGVVSALSAWSQASGSEHAALLALSVTRLLVPVVATATQADEATGADKESEMAIPTLIGTDGRAAIIAFTGIESLKRWRPDARPVPAVAGRVWHAAITEGQSVVIDIAGPVPFVVEGARLKALAAGEVPPHPHQDPDVAATISEVIATTPGITGFTLNPPNDVTDLAVHLTVTTPDAARPAAHAAANAAAQAIAQALAPRLRRGLEVSVEITAISP